MKSGKFRLRVSFLAPTTARDALGNLQLRPPFATVSGVLPLNVVLELFVGLVDRGLQLSRLGATGLSRLEV